ncbi:hypothetical protein K0M31_000595 [Melipona bicolor]|uniref:Uncharacterized protein n=1 Tax=Melipona bicolor TaxID=60889 RepID=A0AA40KWV9_9HYME|nr:hypothetical protein K0M31_000595 [Melipona bicolor]
MARVMDKTGNREEPQSLFQLAQSGAGSDGMKHRQIAGILERAAGERIVAKGEKRAECQGRGRTGFSRRIPVAHTERQNLIRLTRKQPAKKGINAIPLAGPTSRAADPSVGRFCAPLEETSRHSWRPVTGRGGTYGKPSPDRKRTSQ